jgi:hypothetical protein
LLCLAVEGLDVNLHGEAGYAIGSTFAGHSVFETDEHNAEVAFESA